MKKIFLLMLMPFLLFAGHSSAKPKHVLLLNSYNQSMSWVQDITTAVYDVLEPAQNNIILHIENMDTKRIYNTIYLEQLKKIYKNKYQKIEFDLILLSDNNAFDFIRKNREELFGNVPVSFSGVNFFKDSDLDGLTNFTGITEEFDAIGTIKTALKLKPNTKEVFVINDYLKTGVAWKKSIQDQLKSFNKKIKITFAKNMSMEKLKAKLDTLSENTIVLLGAYFKDKNGTYFTYAKIGKIISEHSKVPVFCLLEFNLNKGVVGGNVIGGYYQGEAMSKIAKKILNGIPVSKLPVQKSGATKSIFDYNELQKHNIDISSLPDNSLILNKPISYYETNKNIILTSLAIITLLIIIIFLLLQNIRNKKLTQIALIKEKQKVEKKVSDRTFELLNSKEKLETTIDDLKNTQKQLVESEKVASLGVLVAGVAHEINTPVGISLTAISHLNDTTNTIFSLYKKDNLSQHEFEEYITNSKDITDTALINIQKAATLIRTFKQLSADQKSEEKREFNLYEYTKEIFNSLKSHFLSHNVDINIDINKTDSIKSYPGAYGQVLSILIINTLAHAFKKQTQGSINIKIEKIENLLKVAFKDDGVGINKDNLVHIFEPFYTTNRSAGGTGLGLNILHNIVTSIFDGTVTCTSEVDKGTKFTIIFSV